MNILLMLAHSIEEWHQVLLMHELGHAVLSPGAYLDPAHPSDDKRPALPQVPAQSDLLPHVHAARCPSWDGSGPCTMPPPRECPKDDNLWATKAHLPDALIDWADVIVCHHIEWHWLAAQWDRIRHKRVVWRTVGQSSHGNEARMAPLRADGLQIVRYSPKERNLPGYAGEDALIRFWMDPDEWTGWTGDDPFVANVTQELQRREPATNYAWWREATLGLRAFPAGPGSERIGGTGPLPLDALQEYLRRARAYCYAGTQPASYTLSWIEAAMAGVPIVSIGPAWFRALPYGPRLLEAHELSWRWADEPANARMELRILLADHDLAREASAKQRATAIELFGKAGIAEQWQAFLGATA